MDRTQSFLLIAILAVSSFGFVLADPNGAGTVTPGDSTRVSVGNASSHAAYAGNVSELTMSDDTITQSWQGYYGNVSGAIRLADASGNPMYNWSLASPSGEVFASTASSITWASIDCFNWTANGTALEVLFNINDSVDGVNETFSDANVHDEFYVGSTKFDANACMSTHIFDATRAGVNEHFEEILLHDGLNTIFASLLENNMDGFDGASHDFEMLVLEDGHGTDTDTTPYFFYIELE